MDGNETVKSLTLEQIEIFDQKVKENAHSLSQEEFVRIINSLRSYRKNEKVERYRELLNEVHYLSPQLWEDWIEDCKEIMNYPQERLLKLYEQSLIQFPSNVEMWADYLEFYQKKCNKTKEEVKGKFEECLYYTCFSNYDSSKIFRKYNEFLEDSEYSEEEILGKYKRQIGIPHMNLQEIWNLVKEYETDKEELKKLEERFKRNKEIFENEMKFEQILSKIPKNLEKWNQYVYFRKKAGSKKERIISLYERCLQHNFTNGEVWISYIYYLIEVKQGRIEEVCKRATRFSKMNSDLWCLHLLYTTKGTKDQKMVMPVYQKSLNCGIKDAQHYVNVFLIYCGFLREGAYSMPNSVEKKDALIKTVWECIKYIQNFFPKFESRYELEKLLADVYGKYGEHENGRKIFRDMVAKRSRDLYFWREYVDYERRCNSEHSVINNLFAEGVKSIGNYIHVNVFGKDWLLYEYGHGNAECLIAAKNLLFNKIKELSYKKGGKKRKRENKGNERPAKRAKTEKTGGKFTKERFEKKENSEISGKSEGKEEEKDDGKVQRIDLSGPGVENLTCFAFNLPLTLTQEKIKEMFEKEKCSIKQVRLIKTYGGKSKGYAYIEMNDETSVQSGLKLDLKLIGRKEIRVVRSNPEKRVKRDPKERRPNFKRRPYNDRKRAPYNRKRAPFKERKRKGVLKFGRDNKRSGEKKKLSNDDFKNLLS